MDYKIEYDKLIEFRKENIINIGYYEEHHIKPKCFFHKGTSIEEMNNNNLVNLKASEHFKAHYYLFMFYKDTDDSYKCESMFGSFKLVLDKVKLYDKEYIEECSILYEEGRIIYLSILEKEGLNKINLICDWVDKYNKTPKKHKNIKDEYELMLGRKLAIFKQSKKGLKGHLFCESYQTLIEERGYPDLFMTRSPEQKGLEDIKLICDFIYDNGKEPSQHSKDKDEKKIGRILVKQRQNKKNNVAFFHSYEELSIELGCPYLFKLYDREESIKNNIKEICKWIDDYDELPLRYKKGKSKNPSDKENSLAVSLNNYTDGKNGIISMIWNKDYDKIAKECRYPFLFMDRRLVTHIIKIRKLCNWIEENGEPYSIKNNNEYLLLRKYRKNNFINELYNILSDDLIKEYNIYHLIK